ncbi:hypothetical protein [Planktotalea sp.]|uniref:hypothetical protein n=1 Tax=Planktotalea sp. TaxID=2029877 RepID=UPI003D6BE77A
MLISSLPARLTASFKVSAVLVAGLLMFPHADHGAAHAQHSHGADGTGHDEVNMPGLRGENASVEESTELAVMFRGFRSFTRTVENLPNGIRTVTRTSNPEVMEALVNHVAGMTERVFNEDDPKILIQSPTLDIIFERGDKILTELDILDDGIVVIQTSDDPEVVDALQVHAEEVSAMAEQGMHAVHQMMMKRH